MWDMTREEWAKKYRWSLVMTIVGFANVGAMMPQFISIWVTREVEGLSLTMFWIYFVLQMVFSLNGFIRRDKPLMVIMALSAVVSALVIGSVIYLRF